jgi:hypothetical protein
MSKRIPVPKLQDKLDILLRYDNVLRTRTALAKELDIGSYQISRWQTGDDYGNENMVPHHHYERLLELFNVSDEWMKMKEKPSESPEQFNARLEMALSSRPPRSGWQKLFLEAESSNLLSIKRCPVKKTSFRGLSPVGHPDGFLGERFFVGEKVYVELRVSTPWERQGSGLLAHVVLLMVEGGQPKCLCPSELYGASTHEVAEARITIPYNAPAVSLEVTPPVGVLSLFAILTREPLPSGLYDELMRPDHPDLRDCLARVSNEIGRRPNGSWCCFKQHCYVEQAP